MLLKIITNTLKKVLFSDDKNTRQAPVVQKLDSAIHRVNHYPVDKYQENQLH